jgi:PAS domain S-box-containing protein
MSPAAAVRRVAVLRRELERYSPLFASTTDYVFAKDLLGRYVAANAAYLSALGLAAADLVGHDDTTILPGLDAEDQRAREHLVQVSGLMIEADASWSLQGLARDLVVRRFPWRDVAGSLIGTIGVATDMTVARKTQAPDGRQELHLRGSNARLRQMLSDQKRFGRRMSILLDAGRELIARLDSDRIQQVAVDVVEHSIEGLASVFARYNPSDHSWTFHAAGFRGGALRHPTATVPAADVPFSDDVLLGRAFTRRRLSGGRHAFDATTLASGFSGYLAVPVTYERALQAALVAAWKDDYVPLPEEAWFIETLAVQVSLALHNASLYEQLDASLGALQRAQDAVGHAHHLQALGQVASGVAHDFNNSLTTILGLSDWLLHELPGDTPFYADLETIRTAAQDAAAMVRRLQMFGRLRSNVRHDAHETVDLAAVARAVVDLTRPRCQELAVKTGRSFDVLAEPGAGATVSGSAAELRELLVNLVFNGLDAMPEGGEVRIVTSLVEDRPAITVSDKGTGMGEEVKSRIFEPFFSTKGHHGNGLGLAMCEGIAQRHGAALTVESAPGSGTTFTLVFAGESPGRLELGLSDSPATAPRGLSVLVVDDRADVRDSLGAMVSSLGHAVTKAPDGASALDMIIARRFDVLVSDLGMPGMNGIELARNVAACRPDTVVVLITAWGSECEAEAAGAGVHVVPKPVTMATLGQALSDAVAHHAPARRGLRLVHSSEAQS